MNNKKIEEIKDHRTTKDGEGTEYLIQWDDSKEPTWESEEFFNEESCDPKMIKQRNDYEIKIANVKEDLEDDEKTNESTGSKKRSKKSNESQFVFRLFPKLANRIKKQLDNEKIEGLEIEFIGIFFKSKQLLNRPSFSNCKIWNRIIQSKDI
jgi:hypothetical protein